jgi:hypothetical protein
MEFFNEEQGIIKNIEEWSNVFTNKPSTSKQWKKGRSAYELADFMLNNDGEIIITEFVKKILNKDITLAKGLVEYEVKFDEYKPGRVHDLGIWGKTNDNKNIFIGVESKVNELFNEKISKVYIESKVKELNGEKTDRIKRIENLLKRNFQTISETQFDIKYQLVYSTVGTVDAVDGNIKPDIAILLIIVYKTNLYDNIKGENNYKDFKDFIKELKAEKIIINEKDAAYKTFVDKNKELYIAHLTIEQ